MKIVLFGYEFIVRKYFPPPPPAPAPRPAAKPKEPKIMVSKCLYRDKSMYTREQATAVAKNIKSPYIRIYCCEFCNMWHLTHKRNHR